ncbi:type-F conjugative transfer system pilin assembly protein TrbC [Thauera sp.]|uniref:type-F conjugative transfer system pilin assembly protein TrbC n=2 Tax=Thauera sp. TaxID=1905334 RepID=UPI001B5AE9A4|nr:type-F conjugative transfer system pilin assembly protein TrbC [Thauera sp.]MBP7046895.1 type-F conjugative transfer system pilin assembly protein TrbC [Thauera sp.]
MSASNPAIPALAFAAALAVSAQTLAQNPPLVTDADIERVRRDQPTISEQDIEQARQRHRMPSDAELQAAPVPASPHIDALPTPAARAPIDLEALARGYASQAQEMSRAEGLASGPGLLIFISLSMPQPTLQRLIDQAARAQASIVLRGFANGSLRTTVAQVQRLIGDRQVAVQIDPQAFDRYAVNRVPAFVLVRDGARPVACAGGSCAPAEGYLRTSGDVSLDYALEYMRRWAPGFGPAADTFLKRIRG